LNTILTMIKRLFAVKIYYFDRPDLTNFEFSSNVCHLDERVTNLHHIWETITVAIVNIAYSLTTLSDSLMFLSPQTAESLVDLHLTQSLPASNDNTTLADPSPPSVRNFTENSTLAKIRWLSGPLSQLLWKRQSLEYLTYAMDVVMETSTLSDWRLRCEFVSSLLCDSADRLEPIDSEALRHLSELVKSVTAKLFNSSLVKELMKNYELLSGECPGKTRTDSVLLKWFSSPVIATSKVANPEPIHQLNRLTETHNLLLETCSRRTFLW